MIGKELPIAAGSGDGQKAARSGQSLKTLKNH